MDPLNPILIDQKLAELWVIAVLLAVTAYLGMKWRTWFGAGITVIGLLATILMYLELADPAARVGMELALGRGYVFHTRVASVGLFVLPAAAALLARRQKLNVA